MDVSIADRGRTWAEIDSAALRRNLAVVKARAPGAQVIAVVKADAYGHGLERVCGILQDQVTYFGVAAVAEANVIMRALKSKRPDILLMGPILPEEMAVAIRHGWHFSLSSLAELGAAAKLAEFAAEPAHVHLTVDTGMGRMGALESEFLGLCQAAARQAGVRVHGLASHLPSADEDLDFTTRQLIQFYELAEPALASWEKCGFPLPLVHVLNSAGICHFGNNKNPRLIRPGLLLYGIAPEAAFQPELLPAMTLKTRVRLVRKLPPGHSISYGRTYITERPMRVATLGIGYGDGYPRSLSGRDAAVLLHGRRCPLLGRVTMDQIMVDVTHIAEEIQPGDEVVLYGRQGSEEISIAEIAAKAGTIPWEILTSVTKRVPRVVT